MCILYDLSTSFKITREYEYMQINVFRYLLSSGNLCARRDDVGKIYSHVLHYTADYERAEFARAITGNS